MDEETKHLLNDLWLALAFYVDGYPKDNLKPGTQIIYVPSHADGPYHKDAEPGFVTSVTEHNAFCRYWNKHCPDLLRTTANSEGTPFDRIFIIDTRKQSLVNKIMRTMDKP
ncbi:MAG TPA: hypothetical protein ENI23_16315 [bacterium]|nr:hypothetical protein [bacterium]